MTASPPTTDIEADIADVGEVPRTDMLRYAPYQRSPLGQLGGALVFYFCSFWAIAAKTGFHVLCCFWMKVVVSAAFIGRV